MLQIEYPTFQSDVNADLFMAFVKCFVDRLSLFQIDSRFIVRSSAKIVTKYNLSETEKIVLAPGLQYGYYYGYDEHDYEAYDGYECDLNSDFINSGFKLIITRCARYSSSDYNINMSLMSFDMEHSSMTGFTSNNGYPAYFMSKPWTWQCKNLMDYSIKYYSTTNLVYISPMSLDNYLIFVRFKSVFDPETYKYVIITRIDNSTNKSIYFIDNTISPLNVNGNSPSFIIENRLTTANIGKTTLYVDKFYYMNEWYHDNIFIIDGVDADQPIVVGGKQYIPLGMGLFLLSQ